MNSFSNKDNYSKNVFDLLGGGNLKENILPFFVFQCTKKQIKLDNIQGKNSIAANIWKENKESICDSGISSKEQNFHRMVARAFDGKIKSPLLLRLIIKELDKKKVIKINKKRGTKEEVPLIDIFPKALRLMFKYANYKESGNNFLDTSLSFILQDPYNLVNNFETKNDR